MGGWVGWMVESGLTERAAGCKVGCIRRRLAVLRLCFFFLFLFLFLLFRPV